MQTCSQNVADPKKLLREGVIGEGGGSQWRRVVQSSWERLNQYRNKWMGNKKEKK